MTKQMTIATAEPRVEASNEARPDFFMYTGALKAHDDGEGGERPTVLCTASSNAVDLESDRFTAKALKQMKDGFVGKLIFLNHSYEVPMDVFGLVMKADLVKREGRLDLDLVIGVEMNNPMAVQTYQYIVNGTVLGISVGVIVTEAEKSDDEDDHGRNIFDISGVIPLEASVVGIPANQTAWTRQAIKSLHQRGALDLSSKDIDDRPWLKTAVEIKAAKEGHVETDTLPKSNKDARLWVTVGDGGTPVEITDEEQKGAIMAETNKSDDRKGRKNKDADGEEENAKCSTCELPMEPGDDASEPLVCQNCLDETDADKKDETDAETKDDPDESEKKDDPDESEKKDDPDESEKKDDPDDADTKDEGDEEKDKDADGSGEKKDFADDVAADEAADVLVGKMYTGMYVAMHNLIPILMDTDLDANERAKQGEVVIEDWTKFITETWTEITDGLGDKNAEPDKDFDLTASMHAYIASKDDTPCDQRGIDAVVKKVKEIGDTAEVTADANTQLEETVARQAEALKLMEDVIETVMQLPLQPVTTAKGKGGVAQRLAEVAPTLDTRVVERMAYFDPSNHQEKE